MCVAWYRVPTKLTSGESGGVSLMTGLCFTDMNKNSNSCRDDFELLFGDSARASGAFETSHAHFQSSCANAIMRYSALLLACCIMHCFDDTHTLCDIICTFHIILTTSYFIGGQLYHVSNLRLECGWCRGYWSNGCSKHRAQHLYFFR